MDIKSLIETVRSTLMKAAMGKGHLPQAMSSYQIANRISEESPEVFQRLENECGVSGPGSMFNLIAKTCLELARKQEVTYAFIDARGIEYQVGGGRISPSFEVIAIYRLS